MTTLAVVFDAFLVTFRYLEERKLAKKLLKAESSDFAKNNAGGHYFKYSCNILFQRSFTACCQSHYVDWLKPM